MSITKEEDIGLRIIFNIALIICAIICAIPFITVVSISLSEEKLLITQGYGILPRGFDLTAYMYFFKSPGRMLDAYRVTASVTLVGTVLALFFNSLTSYALSRNSFRYRNKVTAYIFFTMLFGGGLVPVYIMVSQVLGLKNSFWALVIPLLVSPWHIFVLRTFFKKLPESLVESAKIDGAGEFLIYFRIILPLSIPGLATIGLFLSLSYWNDWWNCLMYIDNRQLFNLQYSLQMILTSAEFLKSQISSGMSVPVKLTDLPGESLRMAMCIIAAGPMLIIFVFLQKFFVRGLTIGSVKG